MLKFSCAVSKAARSSTCGRSACYRHRGPTARIVMAPSAFEPAAHPESILMHARKLGLIVSRLPSLESGEVPRLTPVAVEDLLLRPSQKIDYGRLEALVKGKAV